MRGTASETYSPTVVPSRTDPGCYDWVIHAADGTFVARSSYAFATRTGARLAVGCWWDGKTS